jgi:hypothetical protein
VRASALGRTFISTAFYERLLRVENVYPLAVLFCGGKVLSSDHIDFVEACGALATLVEG